MTNVLVNRVHFSPPITHPLKFIRCRLAKTRRRTRAWNERRERNGQLAWPYVIDRSADGKGQVSTGRQTADEAKATNIAAWERL
jgi:hypothetical protein